MCIYRQGLLLVIIVFIPIISYSAIIFSDYVDVYEDTEMYIYESFDAENNQSNTLNKDNELLKQSNIAGYSKKSSAE